MGSQTAINQIIDYIRPEGTIALMGVSESLIEINTRMVLERGLTMIGSSRSGVEDFQQTVDFLEKHQGARNRLKNLIGSVKTIHTIQDIIDCFDEDLTTNWGKTVMKWEI